LSPDYGLDGEVEIFDNDRATGQRFAVQLKGTDDDDLKAALKVRLKTDTCEYYRSLDVPVLIVRYIAPTETVFAEWFHALDYQPTSEGQATVTIRLDQSDRWEIATPGRLAVGLAAFRWVHRPSLDLPLPVRVVVSGEEVLGRPASEWARRIRQQMRQTPGLLVAPLESDQPLPSVELSNETLRANLLDVVSVTIPINEIYRDPARQESLPQDTIMALAVALERAGHNELAARLTLEFGASSSLIWQVGVAGSLSEALARTHRVTDALELVETLRAHGEPAQLATWLFEFAALRVSHALSGRERERYREFLERGVTREEETGDLHRAAIAHYNLANRLAGDARPVEVFHHYRLAAKLFPSYRDMGYWCRETAGVLFEGGRYSESVYFYDRAREAGEDWPLDGVMGDALMFAGRYADAVAAFETAVADPDQDNPEWQLKLWALQTLIERTGITEQARSVQAANELGGVETGAVVGDLRTRLEAALQIDLLCGLAWFNLGVHLNAVEEFDDAFFCFLMAALCQRGDLVAWANALAVAVSWKALEDFVSPVAQAAYFANGDAVLEQMAAVAQVQPDGFPTAMFVNTMDEILRAGSTAPATVVEPAPPSPAHETLEVGPEFLDGFESRGDVESQDSPADNS
jgi:tetratricopeptide (TPR) repeat protein